LSEALPDAENAGVDKVVKHLKNVEDF